ncbi:hypothetical protein PF438_14955 [Elizabethkingia meningoseptica]|uniref:hypothetical protein n=1 Tax=Elizabethkingia meningoseptica TaxID=238 RepID=UPI0022F1C530|nr:hypothetical protein [Elizabethkingia meningoseptica]WBS74192.1 hypothetical protein PF438_14955 [Elizabethkingia meningoseptica]
MEKKLNWFDRVITPKTKAYKDFEKEIKNTAPEIFFRDGERKFSEKEKMFMQIYKSKENQLIIGSAFTVNITFNADSETSVKNNFKNLAEVIPFIERQKINNIVLTIQNNSALTEVTIDSESSKQKFISDSWAMELENRSDLSLGLNSTQIDERQAHHYRIYEMEMKKELAEELTNYYYRKEEPMWNFSTAHGLKVLDLALEMKDFPEELEKAITGYISLQNPYFPERYDFVDDSYDRGESDYEKALERYEINAAKFSDQLQYYHNIFFKYNFNNDKVDALNFPQYETESLSTLVSVLRENKELLAITNFYDLGKEFPTSQNEIPDGVNLTLDPHSKKIFELMHNTISDEVFYLLPDDYDYNGVTDDLEQDDFRLMFIHAGIEDLYWNFHNYRSGYSQRVNEGARLDILAIKIFHQARDLLLTSTKKLSEGIFIKDKLFEKAEGKIESLKKIESYLKFVQMYNDLQKSSGEGAYVTKESILENFNEKVDEYTKDNSISFDKYLDLVSKESPNIEALSDLYVLHKIKSLEIFQMEPIQDIVGKITFYESGEEMLYFSSDNYLNALRRELDSNMHGFKYETLMKAPELVKKVDDLLYNAYGENNPNSLDYYVKKIEKNKLRINEEFANPFEGHDPKISEKIKQLERDRDYKLLADNFSAAKEIEHKINALEKQIKNINNQNPHIMEAQQDFDQVKYLKDQIKYLGFGEDEKIHKDLETGINSKNQEFEIKTTSDKTLPENKVDFTLKFNKSESGGVFLNSFNAKLTNEKNEELSHNFSVSKDSSFTAKEAINLLEGRSVKIEFLNPKSKQVEPAFVQFNFNEPKTEKGNYYFQNFYKNYGVDTAKIVEKSNLVFDRPEWKESAIKSLEKGNILKVKFKENDQVIEGKAVLNPQNRNLKLYDNDMNRLNTNKPLEGLEQDNKHAKANVREQSIKR